MGYGNIKITQHALKVSKPSKCWCWMLCRRRYGRITWCKPMADQWQSDQHAACWNPQVRGQTIAWPWHVTCDRGSYLQAVHKTRFHGLLAFLFPPRFFSKLLQCHSSFCEKERFLTSLRKSWRMVWRQSGLLSTKDKKGRDFTVTVWAAVNKRHKRVEIWQRQSGLLSRKDKKG